MTRVKPFWIAVAVLLARWFVELIIGFAIGIYTAIKAEEERKGKDE